MNNNSLVELLIRQTPPAPQGLILMEKLSNKAKAIIAELGNFAPVEDSSKPLIKGLTQNGIVCYDSGDLRGFANSFLEIANWLDERAGKEDKTPDKACSCTKNQRADYQSISRPHKHQSKRLRLLRKWRACARYNNNQITL